MTVHQSAASSVESQEYPVARRWSRAEFLSLADDGYFDGQRVELIDGEILQMSPIRNAHAAAVSRLTTILNRLPDDRYWVRVQATLALGENFPDPDIAVVEGPITPAGDYPTSALLVIEVSDTTLRIDRGKKASLYASAGIREYWVVNVNARSVEVFLSPEPAPGEPFGWRYARTASFAAESDLSPLLEPRLTIRVGDIFS